MTRKCSQCSRSEHNSRTCPNRGVKIFGVRLTDGSIRKSASMGSLTHYAGSKGKGSPGEGVEGGGAEKDGYASEDFLKGSSSSCRERKKGVSWTEEEHRMFLLGLQKLGKGDWRGISRSFVVSRTPTQVASHAQKYFIRQLNVNRKKRRSSLFDMAPNEPVDAQPFPLGSQEPESQSSNPVLAPPPPDAECESMVSNENEGEVLAAIPKPETMQYTYPVMFPVYYSTFFPFSFPFWPGYRANAIGSKAQEIVKPTAVHSKAPINVDELGGMSKLNLRESVGETSSPSRSLNLFGDSERHSAFHANNPPTSDSRMNSSSSPIHAV